MNKFKTRLMLKKPTMLDFVDTKMSKKAKTIFLASFEDAQREQNRLLKKAKAIK